MAPYTKPEKFALLKHDAKNSGWKASVPLGSGGQGVVSLWINTNEQEVISERRAVKDTYSPKWGNVYPLQQFSGALLPMEVGVMYALKHARMGSTAGSVLSTYGYVNDPIPDITGYHVDQTINYFRCYLEYCAYGDLHKVMVTHKKKAQHAIPEEFL